MTEGHVLPHPQGDQSDEGATMRICELDLMPRSDGSASEKTEELDRIYGIGAWTTRIVVPNDSWDEGFKSNMGYLIYEVVPVQPE